MVGLQHGSSRCFAQGAAFPVLCMVSIIIMQSVQWSIVRTRPCLLYGYFGYLWLLYGYLVDKWINKPSKLQ